MSVGLMPGLVRAAEPKKGGSFRLGMVGANTNDSHDPTTWGTSGLINVGLWGAVYNNLTEVGPDGKLVPELAEIITPSSDAKTWTFTLRRGVTFHNGKTLDADDVVASFNHHRGPDSKSAAKGIVDQITDIKAQGKDSVVFTLAQGNADFPYMCTDYHLVVGPAVNGKIDWEPAIGTGGYVFVSHERGISMTLKRNAGYWKAGRAHFDDVKILGIADVAARMNALITGEVDAIARVDIKTLNLLKRNPEIVINEVTGTQHFTLPMFTDTAPFDNKDVRLALKYAIDREAIVNTILLGHGRPGLDSPITPANRYFAADLAPRPYDPEKAKFHLKQAGLSELKVDLSAADAAFNGAVDTALLYREQALKAGIDINVVREADDGYWSNVWLKKPFVMCYWAGRPTEDWMFSQVYASGADWNDTHWTNARFNELLVAARAELDEAKRAAMYHEMQALLSEDGGAIIPAYANFVDAASNKIGHDAQMGANFELDGWKCIERWWMA
ncbi:MAG: ABC transporter substrate-binding protein [Parvibaculaceae bacterium]